MRERALFALLFTALGALAMSSDHGPLAALLFFMALILVTFHDDHQRPA